MDKDFYLNRLYPFQDEVLQCIRAVDTEFYLGGGTAVSRGYLQHRFSDDLDFFVNDQPHFIRWAERIIQALSSTSPWRVNVLNKDDFFVRLVVHQQVSLKIELINDVPTHVGQIINHPQLGPLDSKENILANKVTAVVGREEPKDLADIWGFCCHERMSLTEAIQNAQSKAAGIFPPDLARVLTSVSPADWKLIRWYQGPPVHQFVADLKTLAEKLILTP